MGLTLREASEVAGLSVSTLSNIERGVEVSDETNSKVKAYRAALKQIEASRKNQRMIGGD